MKGDSIYVGSFTSIQYVEQHARFILFFSLYLPHKENKQISFCQSKFLSEN